MRRIITIIIALSVLLGLILAVTSCPKYDLEPGQGKVTAPPTEKPFQESETAMPEDVPASPEAVAPESTEPAEAGAAGEGDDEAAPGEEEKEPGDGGGAEEGGPEAG